MPPTSGETARAAGAAKGAVRHCRRHAKRAFALPPPTRQRRCRRHVAQAAGQRQRARSAHAAGSRGVCLASRAPQQPPPPASVISVRCAAERPPRHMLE
jgi:hypothetical protein